MLATGATAASRTRALLASAREAAAASTGQSHRRAVGLLEMIAVVHALELRSPVSAAAAAAAAPRPDHLCGWQKAGVRPLEIDSKQPLVCRTL